MWYSASLFIEGVHIDSGEESLWEEAIVVIQADDEDAARQLAGSCAADYEHTYLAVEGGRIQWTFRGIERVHEIESATLQSGGEVFSRFLKDSEAKSILAPIGE